MTEDTIDEGKYYYYDEKHYIKHRCRFPKMSTNCKEGLYDKCKECRLVV